MGQYLSMDAGRAASLKYTKSSDGHLLLCEAVLGKVWHLRRHESNHSLNVDRVKAAGYDSLAVPDTDEIVVYLRFQAVPRYIIHFKREIIAPPTPLQPSHPFRAVSFCGGRFVQRLLSRSEPEFGVETTRAAAVEASSGRDVFLKLVTDAAAAEREADALRRIGRSFAPELITTFRLGAARAVAARAAAAAPWAWYWCWRPRCRIRLSKLCAVVGCSKGAACSAALAATTGYSRAGLGR